jgi:succinate dehydrogenase / fumarate reductase cytochrome b subunit
MISPHLSIYKIQITSLLSILHRISGAIMFCGIIIGIWIYVLYITTSVNLYLLCPKFIIHSIAILFNLVLSYHFCAGIRYLFWFLGMSMKIKYTNTSGWIVIILTILMFSTTSYKYLFQ